jgi:hypothetical protein
MLSVPEGKYCEVCAKTVIDFSQMTENEIATFIHLNKDEQICGTINPQQQNKKYTFVQPQKTESPVKRYIMVILAGLLTTVPYQAYTQNVVLAQVENLNIGAEKEIHSKDTATLNSISGKILNDSTGKPLANVIVSLNLKYLLYQYRDKMDDKVFDLKMLIREAKSSNNANSNQLKALESEFYLMQQEMEKVRNTRIAWGKTKFETKTDMEGNFYLALPNDIPKQILGRFAIWLSFQDNTLKDDNGNINTDFIQSINGFKVNYEGGHHKIAADTRVKVEMVPTNNIGGSVLIIKENAY